MPSLSYGAGAYSRTNGQFPPLTCENMRLVKSKTSEGGVALKSRYGLGLIATNGAGPVQGLFSSRGTLDGDDFSVSAGTLYRGTVSIGAVSGTGSVKFAGGFGELLVTRGSTLRSYNGTTIANVAFPDGANVRSVCFIGSLFVAVRDASAKFYWSGVLDGRTWNALDFATAEREPDELLDIAALGDNIWLFGQNTIEAWAHTGDADLPFTRIEQVAFDKGILQTGCVTPADNSLYFVGSDARVYRIGETPQRVSPEDIEERIAAATTVSLFTHLDADGEYVCLRLEGGGTDTTYELNIATGEWSQMTSGADSGQWVARCAAMKGTVAYFGNDTTGEIMGWSEHDDMGDVMVRGFTAASQLDRPLPVDNLWLWVNSGATALLSGQGSDPRIEMRVSRDAGNSFSDWNDTGLGNAALGGAGEYRVIPEFRRLGQFDAPGLLAEFRVTDPVPLRVSAVKINEPLGGRSR